MRNLTYLFILSLFTVACGGADSPSDNSQLNGKWASSVCLSMNLDPFSDEYLSLKQVREFNNGEIAYKLHQYTDTECSNFGREIDDGLFAHLEDSYTTHGNTVINNNDTAGFIDFVGQSGDALPDIYLLIDDGKTLYFGIKELENMTPCSDEQTEPVPVFRCWETRPAAIDYHIYDSKIDE